MCDLVDKNGSFLTYYVEFCQQYDFKPDFIGFLWNQEIYNDLF